jgi:hypothetical protein
LVFALQVNPLGHMPLMVQAGGAWHVPPMQTHPPQSPLVLHVLATQVLPWQRDDPIHGGMWQSRPGPQSLATMHALPVPAMHALFSQC